MKKILLILSGVLLTQSACDLQPRVVSFPDTVGEFISARYPALLADPYASPEIYNSAASDYGVYASPNLYGTESGDDYVIYASVNDYIVPPQSETNAAALYGQEIVSETPSDDYLTVPTYAEQKTETTDENTVVVKPGDTLYALAKKHGLSVSEMAALNGLMEPYQLSVGQKLLLKSKTEPVETADVLQVNKPKNMVQTTTRVELQEIVVARGDTLYSISRKYSIPVNDLAVMNKLTPPFELSVGQKLRVPNLAEASVARNSKTVTANVVKTEVKGVVAEKQTTTKTVAAQPVNKISSDPTK